MRKRLLWILLIVPLILSIVIMKASAQDHDIAIISVTPSTTQVKLGDFVNITVDIRNEGNFIENFTVTLYYDNSTIETKTNITLTAGANTSLTFSWNTTGAGEEVYATTNKHKTYTINATASTVPGETDTADNTDSSSTVMVISKYIAVVPDTIVDPNLKPGENFTVSIYTDYSGSDVWGWQFALSYNPTIIQGVNVTNGDLIHPDKSIYAVFDPGEFDNEAGKLSLTLAYFFFQPPDIPPTTTSGPGTLANVTFTVVGSGDSDITIGMSPPGQTQLKAVDYNIIDALMNPKHILHGYFRNLEETPIHDVAVISVTPSTTRVKLGDFVNITVVVKNEGNVAETFDVEVKYLGVGAERVAAKSIDETIVRDLAPNAQKTLNFSWEITSVRFGNYTIIAIASSPNDINTVNNEQESTEVVTIESKITPFPIEIILIVVAILAGITILAIYNARRRKKRKPE